MNGRDLFGKLFVSSRFFTIAICGKQEKDVLQRRRFRAEYVLPATRDNWAADPILADDGDRTFLFYEAVTDDHGRIEVAEVLPDCSLGAPAVILQDACHYSYPFVFRWQGQWYMIPESSAGKEVRLYQAERFPDQWKLITVLLREKAVDTTVFEKDGQLYLLTFVPEAQTERVTPKAYRLTLEGEGSHLEPMEWEAYDSLRVRGAGPLLDLDGKLYRPAQISREQMYGDGVAFYQAEAGESYRETPVWAMTPDHLKVRGCYADGLHTYCADSRFEAIDIRIGTIDWLKPIRKLFFRRK